MRIFSPLCALYAICQCDIKPFPVVLDKEQSWAPFAQIELGARWPDCITNQVVGKSMSEQHNYRSCFAESLPKFCEKRSPRKFAKQISLSKKEPILNLGSSVHTRHLGLQLCRAFISPRVLPKLHQKYWMLDPGSIYGILKLKYVFRSQEGIRPQKVEIYLALSLLFLCFFSLSLSLLVSFFLLELGSRV